MADAQKMKEMALFPNQYLFLQSLTTGLTEVYVGPVKVNPGAQERAVIYDAKRGAFSEVNNSEEAVQKSPFAPEGHYIQLLNPAFSNRQKGDLEINDLHAPPAGKKESEYPLQLGRKINIEGPISFPLWPGQAAKVIRGHQPKINQFLLIRIYNAEEAIKNWQAAHLKGIEMMQKNEKGEEAKVMAPPSPKDGDLYIIKGEEVSFFIPPTGVQVLPEILSDGSEEYVREALTLERMEYCILVDENGSKRYESGPAVVFPGPTEQFITIKNREGIEIRKFPAIELTQVQAIHVMVTAPYKEGGKDFKIGEELFISGKETPIYYPRQEHRIITYDGNQKYHATAIPAGEGKYEMARATGVINLLVGPAMALPDPRKEVFVRRALTDKESLLWYPGNVESLTHNQGLRALAAQTPSTRAGAISEGEITRSALGKGEVPTSAAFMTSMEAGVGAAYNSPTKGRGGRTATTRQLVGGESFMEKSTSNARESLTAAEASSRPSHYNEPKYITLGSKYSGAPKIAPRTDYAVMVTSAGTNKRRVEVGPTLILLQYDETLEVLELSGGKPKTTDKMVETVYLQIKSNNVSDITVVSTKDHVEIELKYCLNVDFEGDKNRWFSIQNYVKRLTDHVRSVLKAQIKKLTLEQFYTEAVGIIRDILLGKPSGEPGATRPLHMKFQENGMRVMDVDVLQVQVVERGIADLLRNSAILTVQQSIEVANEKTKFATFKEKQDLSRNTIIETTATEVAKVDAEQEKAKAQHELSISRIVNGIKQSQGEVELQQVAEQRSDLIATADLKRKDAFESKSVEWLKSKQELQAFMINLETGSQILKMEKFNEGLGPVVAALHDQETLQRVAEAVSVQSLIGGKSVLEVIQNVLGEKFGKIFGAAMDRTGMTELPQMSGNGSKSTPINPKA